MLAMIPHLAKAQAGPPAVPISGAPVPAATVSADQALQLEVHVNGYSTGKIGAFTLRNGALLAMPAELNELGFKVPAGIARGAGGLVALGDLAGVAFRLDMPKQAVFATASDSRLVPATLATGAPARPSIPVESGTGATLNYDISTTLTGGKPVTAGAFDLRVFSPWGIASSTALGYVGGGPKGPGSSFGVRLDSGYAFSDADTLRRYRLGDFITGGLTWTRPIRLGGAQVASNFSLRPDLVTFPLPTISGSAAVPSTVDVLVNGNRLLSRQVQAGPFQIPQLPVVTGAGTVSMTVTNALGKQQLVTLPFYASSDLLAPGLQTYSGQIGLVRRNWGVVSNDYGGIAASGTYRRGLSPWLTVEAAAEGTAGSMMAGGGMVVNLADLAILNLSAAVSTGSGNGVTGHIGNRRTGTQFSAGLQRSGTVFSIGASATVATHDYRDIAAMYGDPVPRRQISANAGLSLGQFGSLGVAYAEIIRDTAPALIKAYIPPGTLATTDGAFPGGAIFFQPAQRARVLSLSYSLQAGPVSFYATGFRDFASKGSTGVLFGMSIPLGGRTSAGVSVGAGSGGRNAQMQLQQSAVSVGDFGYQVAGAISQSNHQFGQLQYKSPWGLATVGADRFGQQTTERMEVEGAVSLMDGGLFLSNTISDSFAIVDTNGLKGVRVLQENRAVGRTNGAGQILVPDLRAFDINRIAIDATDVPMDSRIDVSAREVRPQDRSGVMVRFGVQASRAALLRLVDTAGRPISVGSTATLATTKVTVPIGYDGEAYLQDLGPHNKVDVEWAQGQRCSVVFDYTPDPGRIPRIGPLKCQ
jgi:outer membrane usher protein